MKISDVRISNIKELQAFLTENGVAFEADANKPRLQELAREFIEARDANASGDAAGDADNSEETETKPVKTKEKIKEEEDAVAKAKKDEDAGIAAGEKAAEEEKEKARIKADKEKEDREAAEALKRSEDERAKKEQEEKDAEAKKAAKKATKKINPNEVGTPGDRREASLEDLLGELSKKGFENKQQLADLLEAEVRERKALEAAKKEHADREAAVFDKEMKLEQRIRDNEEEFKKVLVHRKQCEEMVAKAVALNERNRKF